MSLQVLKRELQKMKSELKQFKTTQKKIEQLSCNKNNKDKCNKPTNKVSTYLPFLYQPTATGTLKNLIRLVEVLRNKGFKILRSQFSIVSSMWRTKFCYLSSSIQIVLNSRNLGFFFFKEARWGQLHFLSILLMK